MEEERVVTRERILDVSGLEAPEPFRAALAAVHELEEGEILRLCHRREPFPLYETLARLGFCYRVRDGARTKFEILIWRADDSEPGARLSPGSGPSARSKRLP